LEGINGTFLGGESSDLNFLCLDWFWFWCCLEEL